MIYCKKHIIAAGFMMMFPLACWSEALVVDDSDNFAIINEQAREEAPVVGFKYDEPPIETNQFGGALHENALAKDDQESNLNTIANSAKLIDKIHNLQQEVQELRGQLEVQAHDLKLLQQQQIAFYKDLDTRLSGTNPTKVSSDKSTKELLSKFSVHNSKKNLVSDKLELAAPASRVNPADEQISYLAAYELVKNKHYNDALNAMNDFVQKYPKDGYTANAQYWLGELYLIKKDYPKAIEHFNVVLEQFPISSKAAASMLKTGYAYAAQGNKEEAKKFLQQVVRAYPKTPTAQLADAKLRTI